MPPQQHPHKRSRSHMSRRGPGMEPSRPHPSSGSSSSDLLPFGGEDVLSFSAVDSERIDQFVNLLKAQDGGDSGVGLLAGGEGPRAQEWAKQKSATVLMINLVSIMEKMDEQILPAVSRFIGCSFRARPHELGNITFGRALVQALASPLGGIAGHYYNRVLVLWLGCTIWGFFTICFSLTTTVHQGIATWALNGVGLALMIPNAQSMVADYYSADSRGSAFGMMCLTSALGAMVGALYATNIGGMRILGVEGWRFAFLSVGLMSWLIGLATYWLAADPRHVTRKHSAGADYSPAAAHEQPPSAGSSSGSWQAAVGTTSLLQRSSPSRDDVGSSRGAHSMSAFHDIPPASHPKPGTAVRVGPMACRGGPEVVPASSSSGLLAAGEFEHGDIEGRRMLVDKGSGPEGSAGTSAMRAKDTLSQIRHVVTIPSFIIIIMQGIIGSTPSNAMVFITLYLQLLGMSDFSASLLMALMLAGGALGGLLGGAVGDAAARRFPNHGRIAVTQFSVAIGVPLSFLILRGLPVQEAWRTDVVALYGVVLLLFGLLTCWAAPACNNPIFAEIVPPSLRNIIYAFDRSFEGAISAMGAPLVGLCAEKWFGFSGAASTANCDSNSADGGDVVPQPDLAKARAIGDAMLFWFVVPWTLCAVIYTGLHWTYPADRRSAARARALSFSH